MVKSSSQATESRATTPATLIGVQASELKRARAVVHFSLLGVATFMLVFMFVWGWEPLLNSIFGNPYWIWLPVSLLLGFALHELLHAAILMSDRKVRWSNLTFGMDWPLLSPYVNSSVHVQSKVFRASAIAPALLLGILPGALALVGGLAELFIWSALMFIGCTNDVLVWKLTTKVHSTARLRISETGGIEVLS
jgi:hypothetical protein